MAKWQAIVGGETYELSDRNPFDVIAVTGVGVAPVRRLTQRGPLQHGETDIGYRLDPRNINLVLAVKGAGLAATDAARHTLARVFGPRQSSEPLKLRCTRDDGQVRQIDCRAVGLIDMPIGDGERIAEFQRVGVQLLASDPNWYDPTDVFVVGENNADSWDVPFVVPFEIDEGLLIDTTMEITYNGTFDDFPIITLNGPLTDPIITNVTTGDVLDFTGVVIAAGDYYVIDLRYGHKTVVDSNNANKIADLSSASDLATWRIASVLDTGDGRNYIKCEADPTGSTSAFYISYSHRFASL